MGASRTDAGAHATGQTAHLDVTGSADSIQPDSLMMYLNGVLPDDVKVQKVEVAPAGSTFETYNYMKQRLAAPTCYLPSRGRLGNWTAY